MNKFQLSVAALLFATQAGIAQTIYEAQYAGQPIKLVIPKGYCVIPRNDPLGELHYELQEQGNKDRNMVAVLFSDCAEWSRRQADNSYLLRRHGNYLFQLTKANEALLPSGTTRSDLVKVYVDYEARAIGVERAADVVKHLSAKLKGSSLAPAFSSPLNLGLIDFNSDAAFFGSGMTFTYPTGPVRTVGVTAATTARRVPLTINLYSSSPAADPFGPMLAAQKDLVRRVIDANE